MSWGVIKRGKQANPHGLPEANSWYRSLRNTVLQSIRISIVGGMILF